MKNFFVLLFGLFSTSFCSGQITYENGFYINESNQKISCLIKNIDWNSNPNRFQFKSSQDSTSQIASIDSIQAFGIVGGVKYVRKTVAIDRSSDRINHLSEKRAPIFKSETLFLKVLSEGEFVLYEYVSQNLKRYFFSRVEGEVEQLVYKSYKVKDDYNDFKVGYNNRYRQQLWTNMKCSSFNLKKIERVDYNKKELVNFFEEFNNCDGRNIAEVTKLKENNLFNLNLRPRLNFSTLAISNSSYSSSALEMEAQTNFGFGIEAELILSFNKNKWAVFLESTYQNFKSTGSINSSYVSGGELIAEMNYNSITIPLGIRHYFFLSKKSKVFVNASYPLDLVLSSSLDLKRKDNSIIDSLEVSARQSMSFGIGFKWADKFSIECRYHTTKDILGSLTFWGSEFKSTSLILGYTIL